nr:hypothetical protein [Luteibacter rhizovicinus]
MTRILALLLMSVLVPLPAFANDSCVAIGPVGQKVDQELDQHVATAMNLPDATVQQVFKSGTWRILYVTSSRADGAYLFYSASPEQAMPVAIWAGAARTDETAGIEQWAHEHVAGIPDDLAKCFAVYVTTRRSM